MAFSGSYQPRSFWHLALGFLVAPIVPALIHGLVFWRTFLLVLVVSIGCAYLLTIVIAVPLIEIMRRKGWFQLWPTIVVAGILAAVPSLAGALSLPGGYSTLNDEWGNHLIWNGQITWIGFARFFVLEPAGYWLAGAVGGIVFWAIAVGRWQRLDQPRGLDANAI